VFAFYENISGLVQSLCQLKDPDRDWSALSRFCKVSESVVGCFVFIWFIAGKLNKGIARLQFNRRQSVQVKRLSRLQRC